MRVVLVLVASLLVISGTHSRKVPADGVAPKGMALPIDVCTAPGACVTENTGLVVDWYLPCTSPNTCTSHPADYSVYGIRINGKSVTLDRTNPERGSRSYIAAGPNANGYRMFNLLNKELSFDVDMNDMGCGMNAALYFIEMPEDGKGEAGHTGAQYGTGYCDAQPAVPGRPACPEMDIWEANSETTVYTTHPCYGNVCDAWGCGLNTFTRGNQQFYCRGAGCAVDSTLPHTVVTQFITADGTDNGRLMEIRRHYVQNGRRIDIPYFNGYNSLSDDYCRAFGIPSSLGGTASTSDMTEGLKKMVLSMSLWGDPNDGSQMSWMDNPPNGPCPNGHKEQNPKVTFSNIKFGPIGSTGL